MKILFIIVIILITYFVIKSVVKSKNRVSSGENEDSNYSDESMQVLKKYFGLKNFHQNIDLLDLKNKLEIKTSYKKELNSIVLESIHKIDIIYAHNINANKPYTDLTSLKICANEVIDYCIKKNIDIKNAIIILLLVISNEKIKEKLEEEVQEEKIIEYYYELLPKFVMKYNKRIND